MDNALSLLPYGVVVVVVALVFLIPPVRRFLLTSWIMKLMKSFLPKISDTERTALEAGVVWVEKDLFSGKPDFKKILQEPYPDLTAEEKAFLNGPVEKLCEVTHDWTTWKNRDLPQEAWDVIKAEKFFGMIIPKEYGGLGFSALAHSAVIAKLSSRSLPLCVTVMVPNSLGPAELLMHYGTDEQKKKYLPNLAVGKEIPCFALTEPTAGSDAGSIQAHGVLFKKDGKVFIRLNWNKRWITLAAISTTLGIAFRLTDPENILGKGEDVGITCALIPSNTPGVVIGRRHDPLSVPFYNCPTQGHDVEVPVDAIIGGTEWAGRGWQMLMESLAAGRGISLPAQSAGSAQLVTRVISAHATIRKQFSVPIGAFEGIEEPLSRIVGSNYLLEALRRFTCGALDQGVKPPVITAIAKYNATEIVRKVINDAMDIQGGQAISLGPRNLLGHLYMATPIGITVEGANIMTRTLIIFGQGAMRAHPFAYDEVAAVEKNDLKGFDKAFWGHVRHVIRNLFRSFFLSLTRGYLSCSPVKGETAKYYRKLSWVSASFAILADIAMASLGGSLKVREKITGRFADILSWMYLSTAVLRRFEAEGRRKEDLPMVHFCLQTGLSQIQKSFDGLLSNFRVPLVGWFFRGPLRLWSYINSLSPEPDDTLSHELSKLIQQNSDQRDSMTHIIYNPKDEREPLYKIDNAFKVIKLGEESEKKIRYAIKQKKLPKAKPAEILTQALAQGVITQAELDVLKQAEELRLDAITVDDFSPAEYGLV